MIIKVANPVLMALAAAGSGVLTSMLGAKDPLGLSKEQLLGSAISGGMGPALSGIGGKLAPIARTLAPK